METDNYYGKEIGNYRLVEKLDCGSFGCVYRAEHLHLKNHIVAIKLLHSHLATPQKIADSLQEAQFLNDLRHPYILPILDVGTYENTIPYLVLEYCPNGSLKQYIQRQNSGLLLVEEAVSILTKIGQALHYAHQHNIVHRDLKPANILFNANGEVMLADFGIAVLLEGTTFINPYGTPAYMAPEQFQGIVSKNSDQFALGCIAYEMVTGQRPFLQSRTDSTIPPRTFNPLIPLHIEKAIMKALSERHTDRYEDIVTFINALEKTALPWLDEGKTFDHLHKYDEDFAVSQAILNEVLSTGHTDHNEDVVPFVNAPEKAAQLWLDEGNTSYHLQKYDEALVAYEEAIRLDPNLALAYYKKGLALNELKRFDEALVAYEQAIRLDPNIAGAIRLDSYFARDYYKKGVALYKIKRYEEALVALEKAIHLNPYLALAYDKKGVALGHLKRHNEALIAFEQAIRLDPNLATTFNNKGFALANLKRYEEALVAYEQAIRLNPNNALAYLNKGLALNELKRYEEALTAFEQAIRLNPNHSTDRTVNEFPLPRMSSLYYELGYERATRLDPHLALALEKIKHDEKTLIVYGQAFPLDRSLADAYYNKGVALANLKRDEEALAAFEQAIRLNQNYSHAYYSKGITLNKLGKSREAEQAYEKARQLGYNR